MGACLYLIFRFFFICTRWNSHKISVKHTRPIKWQGSVMNDHFELHFVELIFLPPGVSPASRPSPGTPTSPSNLTSGLKTPVPATTTSHNPLANILSKVEITPESILSALSKTQTQSAPALQGKLTHARETWIVNVCLWLNPGFHFWGLQSHEMCIIVNSLFSLPCTSWHL